MSEGNSTVVVELKTSDPLSEFDLVNRDPLNINDHLGVTYEEVLAEPDGIRSKDCVWRNSYKCFNLWKNLCYTIATFLCSIIASACWGCNFACIAFVHIWQITPCFKVLDINCGCLKRFYGLCVHCVCDPVCEASAIIFDAFKSR